MHTGQYKTSLLIEYKSTVCSFGNQVFRLGFLCGASADGAGGFRFSFFCVPQMIAKDAPVRDPAGRRRNGVSVDLLVGVLLHDDPPVIFSYYALLGLTVQ